MEPTMEKVPEYCLLWMQWACMPRSDWASWVQAVGAIVAIVASAGLIFVQHRLQLAREKEAEIDRVVARMRIVQEIARSTARNVRFLARKFSKRDTVHAVASGRKYFPRDAVALIADAIAATPLHSLDSPLLVFEVRTLTNLARQMKAQVEQLFAYHDVMDGTDFQEAFAAFENLAIACEESVARMTAHIDEVELTRRVSMESPPRFDDGTEQPTEPVAA
jgi:hypothetical protein